MFKILPNYALPRFNIQSPLILHICLTHLFLHLKNPVSFECSSG